jgi:hypothetical protein
VFAVCGRVAYFNWVQCSFPGFGFGNGSRVRTENIFFFYFVVLFLSLSLLGFNVRCL